MTSRETKLLRRLIKILMLLDESDRKYFFGVSDGMAFKEFEWNIPILENGKRLGEKNGKFNKCKSRDIGVKR